MVKKVLLITFTFLFIQSLMLANASVREEVRIIYDNLTEKAGFGILLEENRYIFLPELEFSKDENFSLAVYRKSTNTIIFEERLVEVCKEILGDDYQKGIAFILGHELTHFYLHHHDGGFFMEEKVFYNRKEEEEEADINGAFLAYLAGYDVDQLLPDLFEGIYAYYDLREDRLSNYPPLSRRIELALSATERYQQLKTMYLTAQYLLVAGDAYSASLLFEEILNSANFKEVHNNLAVACLIYVRNELTDKSKLNFALPIEMDISDVIAPDQRSYTPEKSELLELAATSLEYCIDYDKDYLPAYFNQASCYLMMEKVDEAREVIKNIERQFSLQAEQSAMVYLLDGVVAYYEGSQSRAEKLFRKALTIAPNNKAISFWADHNLNLLQNGNQLPAKMIQEVAYEEDMEQLHDAGRIEKSFEYVGGTSYLTSVYFLFEETRNTSFVLTEDADGVLLTTLLLVQSNEATKRNIRKWDTQDEVIRAYDDHTYRAIKHSGGTFLIYDDLGMIFNINEVGNVADWAVFGR